MLSPGSSVLQVLQWDVRLRTALLIFECSKRSKCEVQVPRNGAPERNPLDPARAEAASRVCPGR
eukprot:4606588-Prymnesium_polylepis.2